MRRQLWLLVFSGILAFVGCINKKTGGSDQSKEVPKNGVVIRAKFIEGNKRPSEVLNNTGFVQNVAAEKNDYLYFDIQLEKPGFEPDKKTIQYLDFETQNDFKMVDKNDTILPSLVHRIVNGRKELYEYIVVFESGKRESDTGGVLNIIYDDKIFGLGHQVFEFKKQDVYKTTDKTN